MRFDTRKPAQNRGLPLTAVINRYDLLDLLVERCHEISPDLLTQGVEARSRSKCLALNLHLSLVSPLPLPPGVPVPLKSTAACPRICLSLLQLP